MTTPTDYTARVLTPPAAPKPALYAARVAELAALACLTTELTRAVPVVMKALSVHPDNARWLLRGLVADGLAVSETVGRVVMWRRV